MNWQPGFEKRNQCRFGKNRGTNGAVPHNLSISTPDQKGHCARRGTESPPEMFSVQNSIEATGQQHAWLRFGCPTTRGS
jgi:hypothetical protein